MLQRSVFKKTIACAIFSIGVVLLFAEKDNGRFLPNSPFSVDNLYIAVSPDFHLPPVYFYEENSAVFPTGYGLSADLGYNWDGWLFSITAGYGWFGNTVRGNLELDYLHQILFGARLGKVFSKAMIPALPYWLAFAPEIGTGAAITMAEYAKTAGFPAQRSVFSETGTSAWLDINLNILFPVHPAVTPYAGYANTLQFVYGGLVYKGVVSLGVRIYPFALAKNVKKTGK